MIFPDVSRHKAIIFQAFFTAQPRFLRPFFLHFAEAFGRWLGVSTIVPGSPGFSKELGISIGTRSDKAMMSIDINPIGSMVLVYMLT